MAVNCWWFVGEDGALLIMGISYFKGVMCCVVKSLYSLDTVVKHGRQISRYKQFLMQ